MGIVRAPTTVLCLSYTVIRVADPDPSNFVRSGSGVLDESGSNISQGWDLKSLPTIIFGRLTFFDISFLKFFPYSMRREKRELECNQGGSGCPGGSVLLGGRIRIRGF